MAYTAYQKISLHTNKYLLHDYIRRQRQQPLLYDSNNDQCHDNLTDDCLKVYGICDGLLCLSGLGNLLHLDPPIYLYNPSIRKGKKLMPPTRGFKSERPELGFTSLCFGYHDDDYKVIKIDAFSHRVWHKYRVCIYSLNDDSWKVIEIEVFAGTSKLTFWRCPRAKLVNGVVYFLQGHEVVSFDINHEIIRKVDKPEGINDITGYIIMEEYGESIAIIGSSFPSYNNNGSSGLVMMVLKQIDDSYYWEKRFSYIQRKNSRGCQAMGGFINGSELVIRSWDWVTSGYQRYEYSLLNVENGTQQLFEISSEGQADEVFLRGINIVTESLVLLNETTMPPALFKWLQHPHLGNC
ncbi:uncharacterized protein LOC141693318 [Apium graveolens]|uniref:uncharacterized protein LOC141693318 n=1 Tax=Apium graveolens TaxID=4045 RepID=UPI003D79B503